MKYNSKSQTRGIEGWKVPEVMATVGPTMEKPGDLRRAIEVGARWFRFPCGYRQRPHVENARAVRAASEQTGIPVQLLLDLPSSRPRTGTMSELLLKTGDSVLFWDPEIADRAPSRNGVAEVPLPGLAELLEKISPAHELWFCDGRLKFVVDHLEGRSVSAHLVQGTMPLKSSNSIFLPDCESPFATITPQDRSLLRALATQQLQPDWVALSLISSPEDVQAGRREAREHLGKDVRIMAKIETVSAVKWAEDIIKESDGIMVARGDLGLAVGYAPLPGVQEQLVAAARQAGKISVVATQVLEGFAETGLPQRAELSDLALIARQRADAVMLGKETVYSPRPIECIQLAVEVMTYETRRLEDGARSSTRGRLQKQG